MAFPTIPTSGANKIKSSANTSPAGTHTFPNLNTLSSPAGELIIAICIIYDGNSTNAEFSAWGASFTEFCDQATTTTMGIGAAYKWSSGSETGTFTVTSADTSTNDSVCILLSIPGAHPSTPPASGTITNGTSSAANIASLDPSGWGAEDTLWIAVCGSGEDSTAGNFDAPSVAPTNYGNLFVTALTADVVGGVYGAVAFRQLNATSDDPATFTVDTSNARNSALLLAVRPINTVTVDGTSTVTVDRTGAIDVTHTVDGTRSITATLTGTIDVTHTVDGTRPITATETGVVDVIHTFDGNRPVTVGLTGDILPIHMVDGTRQTTVTSSGDISVDHVVDGTRQITTTLSGAISEDYIVNGTRPVTANTLGVVDVVHTFDGTRPVTVGFTGDALREAVVSGDRTVTATITGSADVETAGSKDVDGSLSITTSLIGTADIPLLVSGIFSVIVSLTGEAEVVATVSTLDRLVVEPVVGLPRESSVPLAHTKKGSEDLVTSSNVEREKSVSIPRTKKGREGFVTTPF